MICTSTQAALDILELMICTSTQAALDILDVDTGRVLPEDESELKFLTQSYLNRKATENSRLLFQHVFQRWTRHCPPLVVGQVTRFEKHWKRIFSVKVEVGQKPVVYPG
jgi:hypothetical protein